MIYLLDANVLIDAARDYYPVDMVPEFWDWLENQGASGVVKIPQEIVEEICEGRDSASEWLHIDRVKESLLLTTEVDAGFVARVVADGYAVDLTDDEVQRIGRDPFIIAHALSAPDERCVVTTEVSRPSKQRANRKLPDVCDGLNVAHCNTFDFLKRLTFRTHWRRSSEQAAGLH